jgi:hypothetical protein
MIGVGIISLGNPTPTPAQRHGGAGQSSRDSKSAEGGGGPGSCEFATPEPYGGQLFCPVSGTKLGLNQPAVPVQTAIGEQQPSFLGKLFGQKTKPGAVIYACCPECAEKVRGNPLFYYSEVVADKSCFVFTYATAPSQRPPRARSTPTGQTQESAAAPEHAAPFPLPASPVGNAAQP